MIITPGKAKAMKLEVTELNRTGFAVPKYGLIRNKRLGELIDESQKIKYKKHQSAVKAARKKLVTVDALLADALSINLDEMYAADGKMATLKTARMILDEIEEKDTACVDEEAISGRRKQIEDMTNSVKDNVGEKYFSWVMFRLNNPSARVAVYSRPIA